MYLKIKSTIFQIYIYIHMAISMLHGNINVRKNDIKKKSSQERKRMKRRGGGGDLFYTIATQTLRKYVPEEFF